jgi:hypothetical protein
MTGVVFSSTLVEACLPLADTTLHIWELFEMVATIWLVLLMIACSVGCGEGRECAEARHRPQPDRLSQPRTGQGTGSWKYQAWNAMQYVLPRCGSMNGDLSVWTPAGVVWHRVARGVGVGVSWV